jgi:hypothetical protein
VTKSTLKIVPLFVLLFCPAIFAADDSSQPLPDGFLINGADGRLKGPGENGVYKFVFDSGSSDDNVSLKANTETELLPSIGLSKMIENLRAEPNSNFRLWARVTTYEDKNYLFPIYFLPFKVIDREKEAQAGQSRLAVNEPNDPLSIPPEILAKLTSTTTIQPIQLRKGLELRQDHILADRTGYIVKQNDGQYAFVFDALGRNIDKTTIILLPCQKLESVIAEQKTSPEAMRIKAAGIVTKYQDNFYLLLQRTGRVYSNGNFPE